MGITKGTLGWSMVRPYLPPKLCKDFRSKLIQDGVSVTEFMVTMAHAYVIGSLSVERQTHCGNRTPRANDYPPLDDFRLITTTIDGTIINPLTIQDE